MKRTPAKGDSAQRGWATVAVATGQMDSAAEKDPKAIARGRAGGQARAKTLSKAKRQAIAQMGVAARKATSA
jgi:hypothetical protein